MAAEAFREVDPADPKKEGTECAQHNPTKRLGLPEVIAKAVAFLPGPENSYMNGQTVAIDGGESNIYGNV